MAEIGAGSGTSYPASLDTNTTTESSSTSVRADVPNDLAAAIIAIQTELGTDPAGSIIDVKTFLQTQHNTNGTHKSITTSETITTTVSTGTSPLTVSSTTVCTNLNADKVDGKDASAFSTVLSRGTVTMSGSYSAGVYASLAGGGPTNIGSVLQTQDLICPRAGTLSKFYCNVATNTLNQDSTVTLYKNGSATALTFTITASTVAVFSDLVNTVSVAAGDGIGLLFKSATATTGSSTIYTFSVLFDG